MSDEKYKQEARSSWQEIASIAESVPESASYIHGFIDGVNRGNKELEHKLEMAIEELDKYKVAYNIVSDSSNWESCTGQGCWLEDKARDKLLEVFK